MQCLKRLNLKSFKDHDKAGLSSDAGVTVFTGTAVIMTWNLKITHRHSFGGAINLTLELVASCVASC